ncbi:ABC-2 type transport system ATP-binding protein [Anaeroplasma bactoclasticum]|jgi:ABC-2 type transport system ATP-binding protein|uniref:ABC-2 type transport system ATP-binding protein n=1 Tax=Anaeroplasma bactoclasticum TaxID=2088 RepID=A0A397RYS0_9MOLU|nr:ABC transporter ATP-binding protein [Anaeroplasma bactoclasticum]RIA75541.1 ABC-2 type transport system ATP-binding protein [Anaeroplasma bactoclasticum]
MIEIKNFSKSYVKGVKAVDDLSLTIEDGDLCAFVGLNGAGKSTTIKALMGILPFEDGEILVDGKNIKSNPVEIKKMMAYVPDNPEVYAFMKGIDYIKFILSIYGVPFNEGEMEAFAKELEIYNALGDLVSSYSHGMKQKIVLLAAFLHHPKILVLDEPFVGLDPKATHILKEKMKEYTQAGNTIFFSTHVLEVAEKLCNKVAIIKQGKLVASGAMEEVIKDHSLEDVFLEIFDEKEALSNE